MLVLIKLRKGQNPICTFHFHPSYRYLDRHTDAPTCMTVAPDTLQLSTNFYLLDPIQSEATLILSTFGHHPLPSLKCTPGHSYVDYYMHTPLHTGV